ncbi:MAG: carboxypeptidase-like regulatory domain-containing protein [Saprospiraceae bacterium]|nr:carboxypeptidase-like regulatory domain-containing protein [Saprospiraceae bacterium]MDW8484652.1 carboxypeptidase-like regulatory domain-containing protein [Saprospiraceae bacterium]
MDFATFTRFAAVQAQKLWVVAALLLGSLTAYGQVTTSTITGLVTDERGEALIGATVVATHVPSGTRYGTTTNASGRYTLPGVRVGGPFSVTVTYTGFEPQTQENIYTNLGVASNVNFKMREAGLSLEEVTVRASRADLFSSERTGAASTFSERVVTSVPALGSRAVSSVTKYNPNGDGRSFGAQDARLNNFTIDGSVFNNGFGLGAEAQAGGRTGSTAISLDAIEEIQVNVAPFDVRQTGFVGAGINAVTRSGTNELKGSVYGFRRSANMYGNKARKENVVSTQFEENIYGARIGGPIIKNKVFFFLNGEVVAKSEPATPWVANGSTNPGQVTRVLKSDLDSVSRVLLNRFGYVTGPYEAYNNLTNSRKFLARLDFNLSDRQKLMLRYTHHDSDADINISNSASLGFGNRTTNINSMSYQNSGYIITDNTRSIVAELNSMLGDRISNLFSIGYDYQNEDRRYKAAIFPTIDILKDNQTYISVGFDPFTPKNQLNYGTFHVTNNLSIYAGKHAFTAGFNYERFKSNNLFFPGSNGVYIFNSLDDFFRAVRGDSAGVRRFQYRYSALPGGADPLQVLIANKYDLYLQDQISFGNLTLTAGIRGSYITLSSPQALTNQIIIDSTFLDINGKPLKVNTGQLPKPQLLWEPRLGFNYDVSGRKTTQFRGGVGIFTGRPPYVWLSNQVGNNGVLTGFIDVSNTNTRQYPLLPTEEVIRRFTPEKPTLPSTFEIAYTDRDYRFPQVLKANFAIDQKLPLNLVATAEVIYTKNINAVLYYNANSRPPIDSFKGPDRRLRYPGTPGGTAQFTPATRVVSNVSSLAVLTTTDEGDYIGLTFKLEYPERKGLYGLFAYTYSRARDLMSAGSIAIGSWTSARSVNGNNRLELSFADRDVPHRLIGLLSYRTNFGEKRGGSTQFTIGYEGIQTNRFSYTYAGDMNGDGVVGNDLLFVPEKASDLRFEQFTSGNVTYTPEQQAAFFEEYINNDKYLSSRRGKYTERNGGLRPMLHRFDLAVSRDFFITIGGKRNALQFRVDVFNVGNLINSNWGVGQRIVANVPLTSRGVGPDGVPIYRVTSQLLSPTTRRTTDWSATINDVWNLQVGIRYTFN